MARVVALVVNFNAGPLLGRCLGALLDEPLIERVELVDNGSSDDSLAQVQASFGPAQRLQTSINSSNLGFAGAVNSRLDALADADWVLIANPDAWPEPGAVTAMLDAATAGCDIGLAGAWVVDEQGREQRATRRRLPTPWRALMTFSGLERLAWRYPSLSGVTICGEHDRVNPCEVEAVSGAFMLVRGSALQALNGMDAGFFLHCEDLDLFVRLSQAGYRILLVPQARVVHRQGTPSASIPARVWWHKHRSMGRYLIKHAVGPVQHLLALILLPAVLLRGALGAALCRLLRRGR